MSGFLYFLAEHKGPVDASVLSSYGIEHIGHPNELHSREVINHGPEGGAGMMVGNKANWEANQVKMRDGLEFKRFPPHPNPLPLNARSSLRGEGTGDGNERAAFLGWEKGAPLPTPQDLVREEVVPGVEASMHDGSVWTLPIARECPRVYELNEEGRLVEGPVMARYQPLWQILERWIAWQRESKGQFDYDQLLLLCFTTNYRVSLLELSVMQVLATGVVDIVLEALLDVAARDALKKNQAQDTGNGSDGADKLTPDSEATISPA